jgi:hypothetical protein
VTRDWSADRDARSTFRRSRQPTWAMIRPTRTDKLGVVYPDSLDTSFDPAYKAVTLELLPAETPLGSTSRSSSWLTPIGSLSCPEVGADRNLPWPIMVP